jgi:hypothetical protein
MWVGDEKYGICIGVIILISCMFLPQVYPEPSRRKNFLSQSDLCLNISGYNSDISF